MERIGPGLFKRTISDGLNNGNKDEFFCSVKGVGGRLNGTHGNFFLMLELFLSTMSMSYPLGRFAMPLKEGSFVNGVSCIKDSHSILLNIGNWAQLPRYLKYTGCRKRTQTTFGLCIQFISIFIKWNQGLVSLFYVTKGAPSYSAYALYRKYQHCKRWLMPLHST